jgi:caa(3)-type oxidase subunit IV
METVELNKHMAKYAKIFTLLILLTMVTFIQPLFITFGIEGVFVAQMLIATAKAYLIVAFYMHLKESPVLTQTIVLCAAAALATFLIIVGIDSNMDDNPRDMFQQSQAH